LLEAGLPETVLFETATGFAAAFLAVAALAGSAFLAAGFAAAGLAPDFPASAFLGGAGGWFVASLVAWFEQPAIVKNAAAAATRENLKRPLELNISHLQSLT
jgi:hypothetical protein